MHICQTKKYICADLFIVQFIMLPLVMKLFQYQVYKSSFFVFYYFYFTALFVFMPNLSLINSHLYAITKLWRWFKAYRVSLFPGENLKYMLNETIITSRKYQLLICMSLSLSYILTYLTSIEIMVKAIFFSN